MSYYSQIAFYFRDIKLKDMQLHLLRIQIDINHVKLNIRFPGQLSFQLKNPHLYQDIQQMFPLVNGECKVAQQITIETQAIYSLTNQTYNEVIVDLIISINTTNGKIVAGIVNLNAIQNVSASFPLKRCSDKTASLAMALAYNKIKKLKDLQIQLNLEKISQKQQPSPIKNFYSPTVALRLSNTINPTTQAEKERGSSTSSQKIRQLMASSKIKPSGVNQRLKQLEESNSRRFKLMNKEKEETEAQLEQTKQRYRLTQRREKELQTTIKDLKQANEKKRLKINDFEFKLVDYQKITVENQKRIRQLHQQLKQSKQNIEQLISKNGLLEKRLETKEQSANQKQKRLLDKISQIEAEQINTSRQYNLLLQKIKSQQTNSQSLMKSKEKGYLQEKHKLKQQLDTLQKNYKALSQQNSDFINKNATITQLQRTLQIKISQLDIELQKKGNLVLILTNDLQRENRNKIQMERELYNLKDLENQKSNLKKKLAQQHQQNQKIKDKIDKITLELQELRQSHSQQDSLLDQIRKEKKNLHTKQLELQKSNSTLEKQTARYLAENNGLSSKNTYLTQRLNDLKTKFQQQERQFAEKQASYQSKINSIIQSRQYAISDMQDLKWSLQKQQQNQRQTQRKLREKNEKILEQQQVILNLRKQIDQDLIKFEELQYTLKTHQEQFLKFKVKSQEIVQANKAHEHKEFQLVKKIAQIQQQNYISINKWQKTNIDQLQTIQLHKSIIDKLNSQLQNKMTAFENLQSAYTQLSESCNDLERNFKLQTMSLDETDRLHLITQEQVGQITKNNEKLKQQLSALTKSNEDNCQEYEQKLNFLEKKYEESSKNSKLRQNDLQTYKKAVQQLFMIVSSDETQGKEEIIAVPDTQLSKIQIQALISRAKYISQLKQRNNQLQVEIDYLQKENESKAKSLQQKTQYIENTVRQNNTKIIKIEEKYQKQKRQWLQIIQQLSNQLTSVKSDRQKSEIKIKSLNQLYEQEKASKLQALSTIESANLAIRKLQNSLIQSRSRQIHKKNEDESVFHSLRVQFNNQIELYKEKVSILLKEKQGSEKSYAQKDKNSQLLKTKISQYQIQKQKLQILIKKLKSQSGVLSIAKVQLEQSVNQKLARVAFLDENLQKLNLEIKSSKEIVSEITAKLNNAHMEISELSVKKQKLQNQLRENEDSFKTIIDEQKIRISTLDELLLLQTKKNNKLHEQLSKISNSLQMKVFQTKQIELKLQNTEKTLLEVRNDNQDKRSQISKQDLAIQTLRQTILGVQKEKSEDNVQKGAVQQELLKQRQKNALLEDEIKHFKEQIDNLINKIRISQLNYQELDNEKCNFANLNAQLKQMLSQAKRDIQKANAKQTEIKSRLNTVHQQLKEKEEYYLLNKNKNWEQSQRQINQLKDKYKKLQQRLKAADKNWQQERDQLKASLEQSQNYRDQLEIMLQQRDELIQGREIQIVQAQKRIISLNNQLRNCLEAWEKEKSAAIPSRRQVNKIEEDLSRFQNYASDLDKKTKLILSTSEVKAKDDLMANISHSLIQLLQLIHKAKSKTLAMIQQSKKEEIAKEYGKIKEIIQKILKIQKGT